MARLRGETGPASDQGQVVTYSATWLRLIVSAHPDTG
ncbi:hypothetical protein J2S42_006691 [Catenuloplanes indicus]|uniref:Uncharacterized protein n=1 Tax=Catenuloplanes indicus TaxID=137267 RepID=A0AAE4B0Y0_9ACTN|nr:hypothetical protein [Catenuloplanes indicus]